MLRGFRTAFHGTHLHRWVGDHRALHCACVPAAGASGDVAGPERSGAGRMFVWECGDGGAEPFRAAGGAGDGGVGIEMDVEPGIAVLREAATGSGVDGLGLEVLEGVDGGAGAGGGAIDPGSQSGEPGSVRGIGSGRGNGFWVGGAGFADVVPGATHLGGRGAHGGAGAGTGNPGGSAGCGAGGGA